MSLGPYFLAPERSRPHFLAPHASHPEDGIPQYHPKFRFLDLGACTLITELPSLFVLGGPESGVDFD